MRQLLTVLLQVPLYQSEIAPKESVYCPSRLYFLIFRLRIRGRIISIQQCAINLGILVAFWIQYATSHIDGQAAWRLPMGLQMVVCI